MSTVYGRGRLTDSDRDQIDALATRGLTAGRIAQKLKRHPATVLWYMYSSGLKAPRPAPDKQVSYVRNGRTIHRFTAEEDAFIQALRIQDFSLHKIAELASKRYGTARTHHTIRCRLTMLASREDAVA